MSEFDKAAELSESGQGEPAIEQQPAEEATGAVSDSARIPKEEPKEEMESGLSEKGGTRADDDTAELPTPLVAPVPEPVAASQTAAEAPPAESEGATPPQTGESSESGAPLSTETAETEAAKLAAAEPQSAVSDEVAGSEEPVGTAEPGVSEQHEPSGDASGSEEGSLATAAEAAGKPGRDSAAAQSEAEAEAEPAAEAEPTAPEELTAKTGPAEKAEPVDGPADETELASAESAGGAEPGAAADENAAAAAEAAAEASAVVEAAQESSGTGAALKESGGESEEPEDGAASTAPEPPRPTGVPGIDWYIIHTYSGFENKVKESLRTRSDAFGFADRIGEILIPTEDVVEMRSGKKITSKRMLYPGYVLVQLKMDDELWHVVKNTPRVTGFVGSGPTPTPLTADEVNQILYRQTSSVEKPRPKMTFEKSDRVKIIDGPFTNFTGTVEEVNPDRNTLKVMVTIFGRGTPVELEHFQVEKERI